MPVLFWSIGIYKISFSGPLKITSDAFTIMRSAYFFQELRSYRREDHDHSYAVDNDRIGVFAMASWRRKADDIISLGYRYLGTPYELGAEPGSTKTFDCSSFVQYIFGENGIRLPRVSRQQLGMGKKIRKDQIRKGDLLFFESNSRKHKKGLQRIGHVAVYLGNNFMLHASEETGIAPINIYEYTKGVFTKARRVIR